jgi:two-component system NarL family sensor kinase
LRIISRDWLLSVALRYGLLSFYAATVYIVVLALGGFSTQGNTDVPWWLNLIALLIIAGTLIRVHNWLRVSIDRLVYDWNENPYAVLSELGHHLDLEQDQPVQGILPTIAQTIAATLQLPYVAIETGTESDAQVVSFGKAPPGAEQLIVSLVYHGTQLGALHAAARRPNESLSGSDRRVLNDLARQVGITLHAAQLSEALQASRARLVMAREEERRRIRNDLHDELAPTLSSLQLQLGAMRLLIRQNPQQAEAIANELREDLRQATAEIRRLVYDLRPLMLDELGLVGAIKTFRFADSNIQFEVTAPEPLSPLSAAVEVAAYRIASEACHNVVKHARATVCRVGIEVSDGFLALSVTDNGRGMPSDPTAGVGVRSMRERAVELGGTLSIQPEENGGTRVVARLPKGD